MLMWWNLLSFSVAGDICELAAACLMKFLLLGLNVQLADRYQGYLKHCKISLLISYLSVSRFSINFSEAF